MSQKGRLRRLDGGVRWLETEGRYRHIASMMKCLEMLLDIADRRAVDPAFAADWDKHYPYIPLPPPRNGVQPPVAKSEPAPPPERAPEPAPAAAPIPALASTPTIVGQTLPPQPLPPVATEPRLPAPRPPPPRPPAPPPMPGQPTSLPSPDMEIRPVRWRKRGPQDYEDEEGDSYGKCLTEYDVLGDTYDNDDTEDDA